MGSELTVPTKDKIHLGCGRKILDGYINVDMCDAPGVDLVCDVSQGIQFADSSFREALAVDFVEHIRQARVIYFMNEVHRVLVPGGLFRIHVPEAPGITAYQDPTHVSFWNEEAFTYYLDGHPRRENYGKYYGITARFELQSFKRTHHLWKRFFTTWDLNYLSNCLIDIELRAVK